MDRDLILNIPAVWLCEKQYTGFLRGKTLNYKIEQKYFHFGVTTDCDFIKACLLHFHTWMYLPLMHVNISYNSLTMKYMYLYHLTFSSSSGSICVVKISEGNHASTNSVLFAWGLGLLMGHHCLGLSQSKDSLITGNFSLHFFNYGETGLSASNFLLQGHWGRMRECISLFYVQMLQYERLH